MRENMDKIKRKHCQILTINTKKILKFEPMIKTLSVANYVFSTGFTFYQDQFFHLNQLYRKATFIISIYENKTTNLYQTQKDCHQYILLFVCLECYKPNCSSILVGNICSHKQVNNQ